MGHPARLTVLGSGTAVPRPDRHTSCYLLELGERALLIDLGPGALQRAAAAGCDLERLDGVLITHIHPDHCADLVALQFALRSPLVARAAGPVSVWGHRDLGLLVARLRNAWPGWLAAGPDRLALHAVTPGPLSPPLSPAQAPAHASIQVKPLGASGTSSGALACEVHAVAHHHTSLGYRLTLPDGFVLAFSGDVTEGGDLAALLNGADLAVLEAACPDHEPCDGHLTPRRAGRLAAEAGVRHLLLTHFYPPTLAEPIEDRVRETFEGRLSVAHDGLVLPLSR